MNNPIRRNRNIGTSKQGLKKQSRFDIPFDYSVNGKSFYEKLTDYKTVTKSINGRNFTFIVEKTKKNYFHACTIEDLKKILQFIPSFHYQDLRTIILRQSKRTESLFSSVWGRLVYDFQFESTSFPAIILESVKAQSKFCWSKKLSVDEQKELERIKNDGFELIETKRSYETILTLQKVRNVQLYRTLLHEIGHYFQFLSNPDTFYDIPSAEREVFAHNFADKLKLELEQKGIIPFPRQFSEVSFIQNGLDKNDFLEN